MSGISEKSKRRVQILTDYMLGLIEGKHGKELLNKYNILETSFNPSDILPVFDSLFERSIDIEKIKSASNKLFNILYTQFSNYPEISYDSESIMYLLVKDNRGVEQQLENLKEYIKKINKEIDAEVKTELVKGFEKISEFTVHYTVKENILFPELEKLWNNYQCIKLMWSFHDDIRRNIKKILKILKSDTINIDLLNKLISKVYFNVNTIIFREEKVLFPVMYSTVNKEVMDRMLYQVKEFDLLYADTKIIKEQKEDTRHNKRIIKLSTGELTLEQLELVFRHLPVDITFVDENDTVKYFSDPETRVFPRTVGIIGRKVQNCHPHESVDIVNKIIESFRKGEKDSASFWLELGNKFVLIKYFAVRDRGKNYRGVLEVTQEISDIKKLKGQKRLLDW
ncbi:hypothetical protein DRQ07_02305 [candidate division KSB1 bacterium]|nr:MAG: hypothetical protein DRQ07_02305 [candidate division KSB1 bacterium]